MNGQNRNFLGLDAASGLPVNCSGSIVSQMPGDKNIRRYRDYNQNGFAIRVVQFWLLDVRCLSPIATIAQAF
jgi:hypothetical protein